MPAYPRIVCVHLYKCLPDPVLSHSNSAFKWNFVEGMFSIRNSGMWRWYAGNVKSVVHYFYAHVCMYLSIVYSCGMKFSQLPPPPAKIILFNICSSSNWWQIFKNSKHLFKINTIFVRNYFTAFLMLWNVNI